MLSAGTAMAAEPQPWQLGLPEPVTPLARQMAEFHNLWLMPIITGIVVFVLVGRSVALPTMIRVFVVVQDVFLVDFFVFSKGHFSIGNSQIALECDGRASLWVFGRVERRITC